MSWVYAIFLIGTVWCNTNSIKIIEKKTEIPWLLNLHNLNSTVDANNTLKIKCEKNGSPDTFQQLITSRNDLQEAIDLNFDYQEILNARKGGYLDEVFGRYCNNTPHYLQNLTSVYSTCLDEEEKFNYEILANLTSNLIDFFCYKNGDRLSEFVVEGGIECVEENKDKLKGCFSEVINNLSAENWLTLSVNEEQCRNYEELKTCVLNGVQTCSSDEHTRIAEDLFNHLQPFTTCNEILPLVEPQGAEEKPLPDLLLCTQNFVNEKFRLRCQGKAGKSTCSYINRIEQTLVDLSECQNKTLRTFKNLVEEGDEFELYCNNLIHSIHTCSYDLNLQMDTCLTEAEKYMPRFFVQLHTSILNYYCQNQGHVMKKWFMERNACFEKLINSKDACLSETQYVKLFLNDDILTKTELCSDLRGLKECMVDLTNKTCPGDSISYEEVLKFGDALYEPCSRLVEVEEADYKNEPYFKYPLLFKKKKTVFDIGFFT